MRLLVSVRDAAEALEAAGAGADLVDLKDPARGALGGLPPAAIAPIVQALRRAHPHVRISATIGDVDPSPAAPVLARVQAVAAAGVDDVKVGVAPGPGAPALLRALAGLPASVVPVLLADDGVDLALVDAAIAPAAFGAVMLDTAAKGAGSLVQRTPTAALAAFVARVRASGRLAGLAGALRLDDAPALRRLGPDFAGFRSAVCADGRAGRLEPARVGALRAALASTAAVA